MRIYLTVKSTQTTQEHIQELLNTHPDRDIYQSGLSTKNNFLEGLDQYIIQTAPKEPLYDFLLKITGYFANGIKTPIDISIDLKPGMGSKRVRPYRIASLLS